MSPTINTMEQPSISKAIDNTPPGNSKEVPTTAPPPPPTSATATQINFDKPDEETHCEEKPRRSSIFLDIMDFSKRRLSAASAKASSRRGSRVSDDDDSEADDNMPQIPNITYRKGSIISFPITDDLPCMKSKRSSVTSLASNKSEDMPPIAYRKSSLSIVYTVPDLLALQSSIREDSKEDSDDSDNSKEDVSKENSKNESNENNVEFDDILSKVGEFGTYQMFLLLSMIPFMFNYVFVHFTQRFLIYIPSEYWCNIPELSSLTSIQRRELSIPKDADGNFERCLMYDIANYTEFYATNGLVIPDSNTSTTSCQYGWHSEPYMEPNILSIAVEQNWVCDKQFYKVLIESCFYIGAIIGCILFGWISDKYGRLPALTAANVIGLIGGVLTTMSKDIFTLGICRLIVGLAYDGSFIYFYILVLELTTPKWRNVIATVPFLLFYTAAEVSLPWIAYYGHHWRWLSIFSSIPLLIGLMLTFFLPESTRWLLSKGKIDKAIDALFRIDKINKSKVDPKIFSKFQESYLKKNKDNDYEGNQFLKNIVKNDKFRIITLLLVVVWSAISFILSGVMRESSYFELTPFSTFSLFGLLTIPACIIIMALSNVWGRRWLTASSLLVSSLCLLFSAIDPLGPIASWLALAARLMINVAHIVTLQYSVELIPTVVRGRAISFIHIFGAISSIISIFIIQLSSLDDGTVPLVIIGILGLFGVFACLLLPESMKKALPETFEDFKTFGKKQKVFDFPCCGKS